ncbi:MAG: hypothetical protein ABIK23_03860 [candidate division WOR-3 bacterium]
MKRLALVFILVLAACENLFPPQDFEPTGSPFSLNSGISLISIAGDRRHFSPNGLYSLEMVAKSSGAAYAYDTLPAGLLFTSKKSSTQHMVMLKAHQIAVGTSNTSLVLGVFCCNRRRLIPAEQDSFSLGPLTDNPELRQLAELLRNKRIADDLGMIQRAVWMITDSTGLTQAYIDSINALPSE